MKLVKAVGYRVSSLRRELKRKLHEAKLEFRGPWEGDSEGVGSCGKPCCIIVEAGRGEPEWLRRPLRWLQCGLVVVESCLGDERKEGEGWKRSGGVLP